MGRKGGWFSAVKKIISPHSKKDQKQKKQNLDKAGFGKHDDLESAFPNEEAPFSVPSILTPIEDIKLTEAENEQNKHAYSVALASAAAAEAAVAAAKAAAEVVRLTSMPLYQGKLKEEIAAIKIQTAFRGYLSRRALRALRGLVRLKRLIRGQSVKRQSASTLRCMQTLARLQSQVRERRARIMSEENQALQQQLQQKHEKEVDKLQASQTVEKWDDSAQSKEQVEARLSKRLEATVRRERALAYAFSQQQKWKNSSKSASPTRFMDPNNPHWGWSWLERWMVARPWESQSATDHHNDHASVKSAAASRPMSVGEITKLYTLRDHTHNTANKPPRAASQRSSLPPSTPPPTKIHSSSATSSKLRAPSLKGSSSWGRGDDDLRSTLSVQSERYRRHTISGSSLRDDESLASSPAFPSYSKVSSKSASAKANKSRIMQSSSSSGGGADKKVTPVKGGNIDSVKKRLSFLDSPAGSRKLSGPPRGDVVSVTNKEKVNNGGR